MTEPSNDARNDFSVSMLANQHMGPSTSITERDHELLGVPEDQDNMVAFLVQGIHGFMAASF